MRIGVLLRLQSSLVVLSGLLVVAAACLAQEPPLVLQAKPIALAPAFMEDSYAIYSKLLPGREIEWGDAPRAFWLVEAVSTAVPLTASCFNGGNVSPHEAIKAPPSQQKNLNELLADFDQRCHERYLLDASLFHVQLPVRLLDDEGQKRYESRVSGYLPPQNDIMKAPPTPEEFKGAAGMHSFTAVYFNKAHTLAMTEIGMYCGGLCGNWSWVVLQRTNDGWHILPWIVMRSMS